MDNPKVTIVIPAYNEAKVITPCIEACLNQDYPNLEVIVVDNASSDNTSEVASKFPVRVIREERKGLLWARQCGLDHATGEIVANVDADCLPAKNWVSRGVKFFKDPGVSGVSGPYHYYDAPLLPRLVILICMKYLYSAMNIFLRLTKQGAITIGGNTLIRKSVFSMAGGYTTSIEFWGEDIDTAMKLSKIGKVAYSGNLIMDTSYRRFINEGFITLTLKYQYHFIKKIFVS